MTIQDALLSLNVYPIPVNTIEKICVDRGLDSSADYTLEIRNSEAFELSTADVYLYLHNAPSIVEQEVGVNNAIAIKENMLKMAMNIYGKYDDPLYIGYDYGMIGENWNG